jgi:hypothetical protein
MFGKVLNKDIYEDKNTCGYSDNLNPIITAQVNNVETRIELFSNIASDLLIPFKTIFSNKFHCSMHAQNNYTLFECSISSPLTLEINKSSYSAKFKHAGMLFFWVDKENLVEVEGKKQSKLTFTGSVKIGLTMSPVSWFDDEHCAFGWVCSRDTKLVDYLNGIEEKDAVLDLSFKKDSSTIL